MTGATFLTGAAVLDGPTWRHGAGVLLKGGTIAAILPEDAGGSASRITLPPGSLLAPGLIDIQVNGGGGVLFNDAPTAEAARSIAAAHRRLGTTAILPTLITDSFEKMAEAASAALAAASPTSGILGLHFEGPFLSPARPGVHTKAFIRQPENRDLELIENLASKIDGKVLLTLAPECVADAALTRLRTAGAVLAAGHSAASYDRARDSGVTGYTHVFNAMEPISARAPGVAGAALADAAAYCGVIVDGIHVHPALLKLLFAVKPADRIMLVSDAMPPTGTTMQDFHLQGRRILRQNGRLETEDGTLAGADICLADAIRNTIRLLDISVPSALAMASAVPAAFLGLGGVLGRIAPGYRADLVLFGPDLAVLGTWLAGNWSAA